MLFPALEDKLRRAKHSLDTATSDNITELCKQYLALLAEYRAELYKLPGKLGINRWSGSFILEDVDNVRRTVRAAIENTTRERNAAEALILSFTSISGYEAVETLNRQKYKGHTDWELRAGGVAIFSGDVAVERMTVQDAVTTASLLRREEHVARSADSAARQDNVLWYCLS
ncbi:MAG: hypothetical protein QOE46_510 [Acidobacteriota bacterium]|jgi:hypothetical protein|nr:hypothetical protein [Acidobacteriota bacterium]